MTLTVWEDWRTRSRCLDVDPDVMFPDNVAEQIAAAKAVCVRCSVKAECLQDAIDRGEREGVWGGYTFGERRNLVLYGVAQRNYRHKSECPVCHRQVAIEGKGLRRHNRKDPAGSKGYSQCPGKKP